MLGLALSIWYPVAIYGYAPKTAILLEDGSLLLMEDGSVLLQE